MQSLVEKEVVLTAQVTCIAELEKTLHKKVWLC